MMFVLRVVVFALGAVAFGFVFGGLIYAAECAYRRRQRARAGEPTLAEHVAQRMAEWDACATNSGALATWSAALEQADEASMEKLAQRLTSEGRAMLDAERSGK